MMNRVSCEVKMAELIKSIWKMKTGNAFRHYIDFIQFPFFRNLEPNTRITFDFPLTVFVGPNGSGKSSTLHALYGAPEGKTPYDYWFSTDIDPIKETGEDGKYNSFFYSYKNSSGQDMEVLKTRISKPDNPDYWETSRPLKKYGMKEVIGKTRNKPIEKKVIYINFRAELSAFDKYFYFGNPSKKLKSKRKQEYLRSKSKWLKHVIDDNCIIKMGKSLQPQNKPVNVISDDELKIISNIIGKKYKTGKILDHKFFQDWGTSVLFHTSNLTYSEAFAGSGETSIVKLVRDVNNAPNESLILLDEPEVSIYPGAQKRLLFFILDQIKNKKLQVVISTHSPILIDQLPSESIKVFHQMPNDGKFRVENKKSPSEAFYYLEQDFGKKIKIIVEDVLAKNIIESVIKSKGKDTESLFEVIYYPGGDSVIKEHYIPIYCQEDLSDTYVVLDGDKKKDHADLESFSTKQHTNDNFKKLIKEQTDCDVKFYVDGNESCGANVIQEEELRKKYLKYYFNNVKYLPGQLPEELITNDTILKSVFNENVIRNILTIKNPKDRIYNLMKEVYENTDCMPALQNMLIKKWIELEDENYRNIAELIDIIKAK